jgi:hypothetical protein
MNVEQIIAEAVKAEREACAKVCSDRAAADLNCANNPMLNGQFFKAQATTATSLAYAIRARGTQDRGPAAQQDSHATAFFAGQLTDVGIKSEPLGNEFAKVLDDNLWGLYEPSEAAQQADHFRDAAQMVAMPEGYRLIAWPPTQEMIDAFMGATGPAVKTCWKMLWQPGNRSDEEKVTAFVEASPQPQAQAPEKEPKK